MNFTDSHCHLDFPEFENNLPSLLAQCYQLNIKRIIVPAVAPDNWSKVIKLAKDCIKKGVNDSTNNNALNTQVKIHSCLGIHPWFLEQLNDSHLNALFDQVVQNKQLIVAIGEAGIDGTIAKQADNFDLNLAKQQHFFDAQLALAKQQQLPIIVHHRQSHQYIIPLLKQYQLSHGGIIHAFSGSYQQAKNYIDLGFKLGIGGTITYPRAKKTINAIKRLPLTSLVLETDAPAMPLNDEYTGVHEQVNSPCNIIKVFTALTAIRAETGKVIAEQIEENITQLFFNT